MEKKKVLIIVGHYLPGFKSGGILRSVENSVNHLSDEFSFLLITRGHDIGEVDSYRNVDLDKWNKVGNASVYYLSQKSTSLVNICRLINHTDYDFIHVNSFFDKLSIKVHVAMKVGLIPKKPMIISPRGEFAKASFEIKFYRKYFYVKFIKLIGLYSKVQWHVSSKDEMKDLVNMMNISEEFVNIAMDLPVAKDRKNSLNGVSNLSNNYLKIIFLSRISREKNLNMAINILSKVKSKIIFDIFGTVEDDKYWEECKQLIDKLPDNIKVDFRGFVDPGMVESTFKNYDLFLFPTGGENYGHVIAESLSSGTKVLTSKNTPWLDLKSKGLGWDIELEHKDLFVEVIEEMSLLSMKDRLKGRDKVIKTISKLLSETKSLDDNRKLYKLEG